MDNELKKSTQNEINQSGNTFPSDMTKDNTAHAQKKQTNQVAGGGNAQGSQNYDSEAQKAKRNRRKREKPLKIFGGICLALFVTVLFFTFTPSVNTSEAAKIALDEKVSTSLSAGTILLSVDKDIGKQDYTINHQSDQAETKIWVWDYAAEDGDYVQILVNDAPVTDAFMIKNTPVEITVPAVGKVQIKGIKDGGGGITYAIRYDLNGTDYFNSAPEGEFNTYTLIKG